MPRATAEELGFKMPQRANAEDLGFMAPVDGLSYVDMLRDDLNRQSSRVSNDIVSAGGETSLLRGTAAALGRGYGQLFQGTGGAIDAASRFAQDDNPYNLDPDDPLAEGKTLLGRAVDPRTYVNLVNAVITPSPVSSGYKGKQYENIGQELAEWGRDLQQSKVLQVSKSVAKQGAFPDSFSQSPKWILERGPEIVPQIGTQLLAAYLTRGQSVGTQLTAFATSGALMEAGSAYIDIKKALVDQGVEEQEAERRASQAGVYVGAGSALLERIPGAMILFGRIPGADKVFRKGLLAKLNNNIVGRTLASATAEGVTEAAQEAWQDTMQYAQTEDPETFANWGERYAGAGLLGTIGGTGAALSVDAAQAAADYQQDRATRPAREAEAIQSVLENRGVTKEEFLAGEKPKATKDEVLSDVFAEQFTRENPERAASIAAKQEPSRRDTSGLPARLTADERTQFAENLRKTRHPWQMTKEEFESQAVYRGTGDEPNEELLYHSDRPKVAAAYAKSGKVNPRIEVRFIDDFPDDSFGDPTDPSGETLLPRSEYFKTQSQLTVDEGVPIRAELRVEDADDPHRAIIRDALERGESVPARVLREYPELQQLAAELRQQREAQSSAQADQPTSRSGEATFSDAAPGEDATGDPEPATWDEKRGHDIPHYSSDTVRVTLNNGREVELRGMQIVDAIRVFEKITGMRPTATNLRGGMLGAFRYKKGTGEYGIDIDRELASDPRAAAATLLHEFGHLDDYLPDQTMTRGNILGRLAKLKSFTEKLLPGKPGGPDAPTEAELDAMRERARDMLRERREVEVEIDEEIRTNTELTPEDILAIWNSTAAGIKNPALLKYIQGLDTAAKKRLVRQAMQGLVPAEVAALNEVVEIRKKKVKQTVEVDPTKKAVEEKFQELLEQLIRERGLVQESIVRDELKNVSSWWKPFDRSADPKYTSYRDSGPELYADMLSVLFNAPSELAARAPVAFRTLMAYMDADQDFRNAYLNLMDELAGKSEEVIAARRASVLEAMNDAQTVINARRKEAEEAGQSTMSMIRQGLFDKGMPVISMEKKAAKKGLPSWDESLAAKHALEELDMIGNDLHIFGKAVDEQVTKPLADAGVERERIAEYLFYDRIAHGDRGGMQDNAQQQIIAATESETWTEARKKWDEHIQGLRQEGGENIGEIEDAEALMQMATSGVFNPQGHTAQSAREVLDHIRNELGDARYQLLQERVQRFHDLVWEHIEDAWRSGTYNKQMVDQQLRQNKDHYATFAITKYIDTRIGAGIFKQVGTFEDAANAFDATIMKTMSLIRLNQLQKTKRSIIDMLRRDYPDDIGKPVRLTRYTRRPKAGRGKEFMFVLEDGQPVMYEVDSYINAVLQKHNIGSLYDVSKSISSKTYRLFHTVWVRYNPAWAVMNLPRDAYRTFNNASVLHAGTGSIAEVANATYDFVYRFPKAYLQSITPALRRGFGKKDALIDEMYRDKSLTTPFVVSPKGDDYVEYERAMQEAGVWEKPEARTALGRALRGILNFEEAIGIASETVSKVTMYRLATQAGKTGRERAYIVRNYAGTPNTKRKGAWGDLTNGVWVYSNVVLQGWRADAEVAFNPRTMSGRWFRAFLVTYFPKMMMAAASNGFFGDDVEELFKDIPEYLKSKYTVIPLFRDQNSGKVVYLRIPHGDTDRALAGVLWKFITRDFEKAMPESIGLVAGEVPGINPYVTFMETWSDAAAGQNPRDDFRQQDVIPRKQQSAGGAHRWRPMLKWTFDQFGFAGRQLGSFVADDRGLVRENTGTVERVATQGGIWFGVIGITDRGRYEDAWEKVNQEQSEKDRRSLDMPPNVQALHKEMYPLNRLDPEDLTAEDRNKRAILNQWNTNVYRPRKEGIDNALNRGDYERAKELRRKLEDVTNRTMDRLIDTIR